MSEKENLIKVAEEIVSNAKKNEEGIKLSDSELLRLENILLKEELWKNQSAQNRANFYSLLARNYNIDVDKYDIMVDPQSGTLLKKLK